MRFTAALGRGLRADRSQSARELVAAFRGNNEYHYPFRGALILTDALAGYADDLLRELTVLTAGTYQFFGGGAGDDAAFQRTHVFYGTEAVPDAVVGLEILSTKPLGIGVGHGWQPASSAMRVTEADGFCVASLNAVPTVEVLAEHARATEQRFDTSEPLPFFLHNVLGIATDAGYKLRVPLALTDAGAIACAAEVPAGAAVRIMGASDSSTNEAAAQAARNALAQLSGHAPAAGLVFDCAATRLRLGDRFGAELAAVESVLGPVPYAGCNTYGQIARAKGQFTGFHNCTAVVCLFPE
jgi:hypothetical protein